ncbi:MAG TPA: hypothetical protein DCY55_11735 [Gammaproteobacteria bacterium]|jgi:hypothetical protein|nr:hypothetical protein [Gammaproteobacteria bacterium]
MTDQVIERAVAKFIELRDKKKVLTDEHKLILAPYNEAMTKIENLVLAELQKAGVQNMKTPAGTTYQSTTVRPKIDDWKLLRPFILDNDLIDMMQMKLTPEAVEQYRESTGELPPGVVITSETFARFKK